MRTTADRKFDWIAGLSVALGMAVILPSILVLAISIFTVGTASLAIR